jgi:OFA family oxalate/formate antiporter-like MFS transporter
VAVEVKSESTSDAVDFTPSQMMKHPGFWLFFLWNVCMCSAGLMVINSAANIAVAYGAAGILGLLVSVCNGFSRIPLGIILDKLGQRKTMLVANLMLITTGLLLFVGGSLNLTAMVFIGMLLMGACYGSSVTISTSVVRQFYGEKNYAVNLSIVNCCAIPSSFIGPMLSGALIDASGGLYISTFGVILAIALVDIVIGFFVRKPKIKNN